MNTIKTQFENQMNYFAEIFYTLEWEDKKTYLLWLQQVYFIVRHSTRLLALSAAHFDFNHEGLHKRFLMHITEELGHEKLALNDLIHAGQDKKNFIELSSTKNLINLQYQKIPTTKGIAMFGYILLLEGLAVKLGNSLRNKVDSIVGTEATSFLKLHALEDQDHIRTAFETLKTLSQDERQIVSEHFNNSATLYMGMLKEIKLVLRSFTKEIMTPHTEQL